MEYAQSSAHPQVVGRFMMDSTMPVICSGSTTLSDSQGVTNNLTGSTKETVSWRYPVHALSKTEQHS